MHLIERELVYRVGGLCVGFHCKCNKSDLRLTSVQFQADTCTASPQREKGCTEEFVEEMTQKQSSTDEDIEVLNAKLELLRRRGIEYY